jgi:glutamate formiminotransferase
MNFSEGRRAEVIEAIVAAAREIPGSTLADYSTDPDHNRMVVTVLGGPEAICKAARAAARVAVEKIDLRHHKGAHPRAGAVDVVPVVPIRGISMAGCVEVAAEIGRDFTQELHLPVYFYERSAGPGRRAALPEIRKGGFEGLFTEPMTGLRAPDLGPNAPHPTAGIVVVGAREPLVAYNIDLETEEVAVARRIAAALRRDRETRPELIGVRALGLWLPSRRCAQVSLNLTRPALTPMPDVFDYVREAAAREGIDVRESEVIGLIPRVALGGEPPSRILWNAFRETQLLEHWLGAEPV